MNERDYYEILGIDSDASDEEIRRAFYKLALKYHPDRNRDPGAEERFKEIYGAYEALLGDKERRRQTEKREAKCDMCMGSGDIISHWTTVLGGESLRCPKCFGSGKFRPRSVRINHTPLNCTCPDCNRQWDEWKRRTRPSKPERSGRVVAQAEEVRDRYISAAGDKARPSRTPVPNPSGGERQSPDRPVGRPPTRSPNLSGGGRQGQSRPLDRPPTRSPTPSGGGRQSPGPPVSRPPVRSPNRSGGGRGWLWAVVILAALGIAAWLGRDNIALVISDLRTAATSSAPTAAPSRARTVTILPTAEPTTSPSPAATVSPTPSPTATLRSDTRLDQLGRIPLPSATPTSSPAPTAAIATTSTAVLPQAPTATATLSPMPSATVVPSLSPAATSTPAASPTPMPTDAQTPGYTTKHGSVLPLIDTSVLEDSITSLINDVRLTNNVESLIRESGLDNFAAAHSRLMADSKLLDAKAIEASCGSSGTQVVHWPQVKSFSYRGPATSPDTTTPTIYDKTAEQAASGIVENIHEGVNPYTKSSNYRYIGVGVVQTLDELGFMEFWITFYLTDCMVEAPTATSTAAATATPSPMPTATVPPTATPIPPLESTATSTQMATSTPPAPTATATLSSAPTATSTPVATTTVSPTPTATASPTHTAASFSLRDFTNGRWLEQQDPQLASSINQLGWTQDGIDGTEAEAIQDLLYIAVASRPVAASIVSLAWVLDDIDWT